MRRYLSLLLFLLASISQSFGAETWYRFFQGRWAEHCRSHVYTPEKFTLPVSACMVQFDLEKKDDGFTCTKALMSYQSIAGETEGVSLECEYFSQTQKIALYKKRKTFFEGTYIAHSQDFRGQEILVIRDDFDGSDIEFWKDR